MFDDMPMKRPLFFLLIAGRKYFELKKCDSRFVAIVFRHIEFFDRVVREITRVIHKDIHFANCPWNEGGRSPALRSIWVNWKHEELAGFDGRRQPRSDPVGDIMLLLMDSIKRFGGLIRDERQSWGQRTRYDEVRIILIDAADEAIAGFFPHDDRIVARQQRKACLVIGEDAAHAYKPRYPAFDQNKHHMREHILFIGVAAGIQTISH